MRIIVRGSGDIEEGRGKGHRRSSIVGMNGFHSIKAARRMPPPTSTGSETSRLNHHQGNSGEKARASIIHSCRPPTLEEEPCNISRR